jgi:hypothetical protein
MWKMRGCVQGQGAAEQQQWLQAEAKQCFREEGGMSMEPDAAHASWVRHWGAIL